MYKKISKEEFTSNRRNETHDKFAKTFIAKANAMGLWDDCWGLVDGFGNIQSAVIMTTSKRKPTIVNLQLLHTFHEFRRKGFAKQLVEKRYNELKMEYFRVSSEPEALPFYLSLGLKFWGRQKSGSYLCMHRVDLGVEQGIYDKDIVIRKALFSKRKGALVECFERLLEK